MLYRGVCKRLHDATKGKLTPRGTQIEVAPRYDGKSKFDGRLTYGVSEVNAVRAQHIDSGTWDNCFVSTSRSRDVAFACATTDFVDGVKRPCDGFIYWIDESLFAAHSVVAHDLADLLYPNEKECSIRAADGGMIPEAVIVKVEHVTPWN